MLEGESVSGLAQDFSIRRKLLYEWRDQYRRGGVDLLRTVGRPPRGAVVGFSVRRSAAQRQPPPARAETRVAELERKIGQQQVVIDFLAGALSKLEGGRVKKNSTGAAGFTLICKR